jgi:hypothetical protein
LCRRFMPAAGWWALDRLGILALPSRPLEALVALGTDVRVLCGPVDSVIYLNRAAAVLRRLAQTGRFSFEVIDLMDHALFVAEARRLVTDYFRDRLLPALDASRRRTDPGATSAVVMIAAPKRALG